MGDNGLKDMTPVPYAKGNFHYIGTIDEEKGLALVFVVDGKQARMISDTISEYKRLRKELSDAFKEESRMLREPLTVEREKKHQVLIKSLEKIAERLDQLQPRIVKIYSETPCRVIALKDLPEGIKEHQVIPAPVYQVTAPVLGQSVPPKTEEPKKRVAMK